MSTSGKPFPVVGMGHSWVEIEISDLERKKSKKVNALVDTGATLTTLPEAVAEEVDTIGRVRKIYRRQVKRHR